MYIYICIYSHTQAYALMMIPVLVQSHHAPSLRAAPVVAAPANACTCT